MGTWTTAINGSTCGYDGHAIAKGEPVYLALNGKPRCRKHAEQMGATFGVDSGPAMKRAMPDLSTFRSVSQIGMRTDFKSAASGERDSDRLVQAKQMPGHGQKVSQ